MMPQTTDPLLLVLQHRFAGKAWCYNGEGYDGVHWSDDEPKPTEKQLLAQVSAVETEIAEQKQAFADAEAARKQATVSAKAKLAALGLTDDEINALLGG